MNKEKTLEIQRTRNAKWAVPCSVRLNGFFYRYYTRKPLASAMGMNGFTHLGAIVLDC